MTSNEPLDRSVGERLVDDLLVHLVREVVVQRAAVDGPLAGAGDDAHAGDGLLAAAGRRGGRDDGRAARRVLRTLRRRLGAVGDLAVVLGERGDLVVESSVSVAVSVTRWFLASVLLVDARLLGDLGDLERLRLLGACGCSGPA